VTAQVGEVTVPIDFVTAPPFPTNLSERSAVDLSLINGVDPRNLVLGAEPDATITFRNEIAAFKNTLGVVLIGADGTVRRPHDPRARRARAGGRDVDRRRCLRPTARRGAAPADVRPLRAAHHRHRRGGHPRPV
jgi:hypothetical protein